MPRVSAPPPAAGVRAAIRARYAALADRYPEILTPVEGMPTVTPWARMVELIDAGRPVEVPAWELGPFAPQGAPRSSRWIVHADDRLEPAPPLDRP